MVIWVWELRQGFEQNKKLAKLRNAFNNYYNKLKNNWLKKPIVICALHFN